MGAGLPGAGSSVTATARPSSRATGITTTTSASPRPSTRKTPPLSGGAAGPREPDLVDAPGRQRRQPGDRQLAAPSVLGHVEPGAGPGRPGADQGDHPPVGQARELLDRDRSGAGPRALPMKREVPPEESDARGGGGPARPGGPAAATTTTPPRFRGPAAGAPGRSRRRRGLRQQGGEASGRRRLRRERVRQEAEDRLVLLEALRAPRASPEMRLGPRPLDGLQQPHGMGGDVVPESVVLVSHGHSRAAGVVSPRSSTGASAWRSRSSPRRIRPFTVPSGSSVSAAMSVWVMPP